MTFAHRLLILDRDLETRSNISLIPERENEELVADSVTTISEAMASLIRKGYEAVLCRIDSPEELSFLIRIRHAAPTIPIVALTPHNECTLEALARESGANEVRSRGTPFTKEGGPARRIIGVHELIERTRAALARHQELGVENQALRALTKRTMAKSQALLKGRIEFVRPLLEGFRPLLVEGDSERALLLKRAFEKTALPFPLPILGDGEAAIRYLGGREGFGNRVLYPLPTLVLLDYDLPKNSGLEVLKWIRSRPETARLLVFVLTNSGEEFDQTMAEGADFIYPKPGEFVALKAQARAVAVRWSMLEEARELWKKNPPPLPA